jgi:oxygen-independent coproporphyrinogen-3 oxidase
VTAASSALDGGRYQAYSYAYPHKTSYRRLEPPVALDQLWAGERRDALSLYIHVPFCEYRCGFCNLFTRPTPDDDDVAAYLGTLARQVAVVRRALDAGGAFAFARAAIGGGTPTYLDPHQLERVVGLLRAMGAPASLPMSVETSPETAVPDRLAVLVAGGTTRISIGVQSFDDAEARSVNRPQRAVEVHRALAAIRDSGVPTLNIDLMYGLPDQTATSWQATLDAALGYRPEELYLYPLYVRPLTTLGRREAKQAGAVVADEFDEIRAARYDQARAHLLAAGYEQVSLRMFRKVGATASPGPVYCCQDDGMIGLGCGARSYTRALHYSSEWAVGARGVRDIIARWIARSDAELAVADYGVWLDADEQRRRWLILSLLSDAGVDRAGFRARFGVDAVAAFPQLGELAARGLATLDDATLALTEDGHARADAIGPWLYSPAMRQRMDGFELA